MSEDACRSNGQAAERRNKVQKRNEKKIHLTELFFLLELHANVQEKSMCGNPGRWTWRISAEDHFCDVHKHVHAHTHTQKKFDPTAQISSQLLHAGKCSSVLNQTSSFETSRSGIRLAAPPTFTVTVSHTVAFPLFSLSSLMSVDISWGLTSVNYHHTTYLISVCDWLTLYEKGVAHGVCVCIAFFIKLDQEVIKVDLKSSY